MSSEQDDDLEKNTKSTASDELEDDDYFPPLRRNYSLKVDDDASLASLVDTIKLINKRDSERHLMYLAKQSPWVLDSGTPMISSPHLVYFPDLFKRRKDQIQKHEAQKREAKRDAAERREAKRRDRSMSEDEGVVDNNKPDGFITTVHDEDEQWERKRKQKLQKVMKASASDHSFAMSTSSSGGSSKYSPSREMLKELRDEFARQSNPPSVSVMYGLVNAVIVLPVIMSFGNIIYHDDFFRPYLPVLVKLTVVSGVVHQFCFSTLSTLPFAVGSVQDAGLIFLSTIASSIVRYCKDRGCDDEQILATTLVGLSIFTASLGIGLIVIGKLKLAGYVQKLPTPVVGGYLAFIGFFCGQSALCLLSGKHVTGIMEWYKFMEKSSLLLLAPGVIGGVGIYISVRKLKHMAVLPTSIALLVAIFYGSLKWFGLSLEDAKDIGLMSRADAPPAW